MSGSKKKTPAEELIESLLKDVGGEMPDSDEDQSSDSSEFNTSATNIEGLVQKEEEEQAGFLLSTDNVEYGSEIETEFEGTRNADQGENGDLKFSVDEDIANLPAAMGALVAENLEKMRSSEAAEVSADENSEGSEEKPGTLELKEDNAKTEFITQANATVTTGDSDKTVAVAGYQVSNEPDYSDKVKMAVGQNRSGYSAWNSGGSADSNLAQAENLRIAQEKLLDLEHDNEKLRLQNEELMAASEIIKERSDLLSSQLNEYKKDRDGLEESFKNEIVLLKNHLARKDTELQRAQFKTDELESRLKFDMKKIRIRERELENRLELVRAEKNAIVKNKDEQILDLRRKMDVLQMEVESYRQKCVELNKLIENNQESFKRTTRALRLAMANLELQEENKVPLKKVD